MINHSIIKVKSSKSSSGHDIDNLYLFHEPKVSSVVILFPGKGYTCSGPLLYYARKTALQFGNDVLAFETDVYNQPFENIFEAVKECLNNQYEKIFFISKSLGTKFAGEMSKQIGYDRIHNMFLTPIPDAAPYICETECSVIYGSKDTFMSDEIVNKLRNFPNVGMHVIKDAGHSLEIQDDYLKSLEALTYTAKQYERFFTGEK